ncbi:MAG: hypothetical protein NT027_03950 [Proteobacteria bacterium]|nr:hypothetical protein [Pseudomonadota bacterium]
MNSNIAIKNTTKSMKNKMGQNTAEYMLLLLLIGGGSIMAFKMFGKGIVNRFASVTSVVTGGGGLDSSNIKSAAKDLGETNKGDIDFKTFDAQQ